MLATALIASVVLSNTPAMAENEAPADAAAAKAQIEKALPVWLRGLWAEAKARGVSTATFDKAFTGVKIDWSLPDLAPPPGVRIPKAPEQAEFRAPRRYFPPKYLNRMSKDGATRRTKHRDMLEALEKKYGVPDQILLAIWGRETSYSRVKIPHDVFTALTTLAYVGRRKRFFRRELLAALEILEKGHASRAAMKSSWAGAMGHTQFLPSKILRYGTDGDGDGKADIWGSLPDAMATTASFLKAKGWVPKTPWFYEVKLPKAFDCTLQGPRNARPIGEWSKLLVKRTKGRAFPKHRLDQSGFLVLPAGLRGPAFVALKNFSVLKEYNRSDLYALFVGHLADRIASSPNFAGKWRPVDTHTRAVVRQMQENLAKLGHAAGRADGLVGARTRAAVGKFQKKAGLPLDCWPSKKVISAIAKAARGS